MKDKEPAEQHAAILYANPNAIQARTAMMEMQTREMSAIIQDRVLHNART